MPFPWSLFAVPVLILLNAFFVVAEYALVAIRPAQIDLMRPRRPRAAAAMAKLKADTASAIGAIQVCITMTNLLLGWIGEPALSELLLRILGPLAAVIPPAAFAAGSTALAFVLVTLLTVVFSELLPKAMTLRYVGPAATLTARPILLIMRAVRPLVWLMNAMANAVTVPLRLGRVDDPERQVHSAAELVAITREAASDGVLTDRERSIILNALALGQRTARHVMVPRMQVAYLDLKRSMDENRRVVQERLFSRLPLCDGGLDHVVGIVAVKEFMTAFYGHGDPEVLRLIAHPAEFVGERTPTDKLVTALLDTKSKMVVVVDEYGGVEGIATLDDVVDDLFGVTASRPRGQLGRSVDAPPPPVDGAGRELDLPGDTPIHEVAAQLGRDGWGETTDVVTVGGLMVSRLGRVPAAGESVDVGGVTVRATESDGRAVRRVVVAPPPLGLPADVG